VTEATPWLAEFERRCRRVLGITDDTQPVEVEVTTTHWSTMTGDETTVWLIVGSERREFLWMGDLIQALDAVEDEAS
jgi:hypothetical protein